MGSSHIQVHKLSARFPSWRIPFSRFKKSTENFTHQERSELRVVYFQLPLLRLQMIPFLHRALLRKLKLHKVWQICNLHSPLPLWIPQDQMMQHPTTPMNQIKTQAPTTHPPTTLAPIFLLKFPSNSFCRGNITATNIRNCTTMLRLNSPTRRAHATNL